MLYHTDDVGQDDVPVLEDAITSPDTSRPVLTILDLPPELLEKIFTYLHPGDNNITSKLL
jgi:hypothetical protein